MVDITQLTLSQINDIKNMVNNNIDCAYKIGEKYLIRTVTLYYTGKLEKIFEKELVFSSAAWIADTGRYSKCLETGEFEEVEPINNDLIISRECIIDCVKFNHDLPRRVK